MLALAPATQQRADALRSTFVGARPFRHWVCENFFDPAFARQLLQEFPDFEHGNARNEMGELGGKSVVERIRQLGPTYAALDDTVQSPEFLTWLSQATGIPNLLYDPWYFGGGTHENRHGQELDPHIDFNRHPENGWHRRLNLIVYLNEDWDPRWGGSLELHTDPRQADNQVSLIAPSFNRGVLFETTEWSWHGFGRIDLPESQRLRSRKSIALYFYTKARPEEERAPTHSTVYVDRPLPEQIQAGHRLSEADVLQLQALLTRRDSHIQRLYGEVSGLQAQLDEAGLTHYGRPSGHFRRLGRGLLELVRRSFVERRLSRAIIKSAMLPFVRFLPARLREPLRKYWRKSLPTTQPPASAAPSGPSKTDPGPPT